MREFATFTPHHLHYPIPNLNLPSGRRPRLLDSCPHCIIVIVVLISAVVVLVLVSVVVDLVVLSVVVVLILISATVILVLVSAMVVLFLVKDHPLPPPTPLVPTSRASNHFHYPVPNHSLHHLRDLHDTSSSTFWEGNTSMRLTFEP